MLKAEKRRDDDDNEHINLNIINKSADNKTADRRHVIKKEWMCLVSKLNVCF